MNKTKKLIAFPENLIKLVEVKANTFGFTFGEYVRYVLANDVKTITQSIEIMDSETENDFSDALIDIQNNKVTRVRKEDIAKHLNKIVNAS